MKLYLFTNPLPVNQFDLTLTVFWCVLDNRLLHAMSVLLVLMMHFICYQCRTVCSDKLQSTPLI